MKKLNQLLIIEAEDGGSLLSGCGDVLQAISDAPVTVQSPAGVAQSSVATAPPLVLYHSKLNRLAHLQQFVQLQSYLLHSTLIIVSEEQDEELCFLALEAGAEDVVRPDGLTLQYLRKAVLLSHRRAHVEKELHRSREQLLACIQNTPNVAVQWYNANGQVVFWNNASESLFRKGEKEALGRKIDELFPIEGDDRFWQKRIEVLATGQRKNDTVEWKFRHRNNEESFFVSTFFLMPSFEKEPWYVCMDVDITGLKKTEKALQESEERYQTLFKQASDAIFLNDSEGNMIDANDRAVALCGYSRQKLMQMKVPDLYDSEQLARLPIDWDALQRGERISMERNLVCADGAVVTAEITAQQLKDGRIMAIVRNVSEAKATQEALRLSEERYRRLVEQQADAITIFNERGEVLESNQSATDILGYTHEEFRKMSLTQILVPEDLQNNPINFELLRTGISTIKQRRLRRKDGSIVQAEVHTKHLWDSQYLSSVRDLTDRLEVQHQLEREKYLSDSIINSLPGLFYLFTKEGKYLRWNRQLEIVTGYKSAEVATLSPLDLFEGEEKELILTAITEVFRTGRNSAEAHLVTKSGCRIPYFFTGVAISYAGEECLMGVGTDISEVRRLESELALQKIAEQKKVMQAMIAAAEKEKNKLGLELHDNVNQILSVVRMYLSLLDSGQGGGTVTLAQTMNLLNNAMDEIRSLSHSLAVSYKYETGLSDALEELMQNIKRARDFSIDMVLPEKLDDVISSSQKLAVYRIVQEQFSNIIKHAKASAVKVEIELLEATILLRIADNGKGFNPLQPKKGLGLSNITNRAEALNGWVQVHAAPGQGCTLVVGLPISSSVEELS